MSYLKTIAYAFGKIDAADPVQDPPFLSDKITLAACQVAQHKLQVQLMVKESAVYEMSLLTEGCNRIFHRFIQLGEGQASLQIPFPVGIKGNIQLRIVGIREAERGTLPVLKRAGMEKIA
jgi:hypothetical protein